MKSCFVILALWFGATASAATLPPMPALGPAAPRPAAPSQAVAPTPEAKPQQSTTASQTAHPAKPKAAGRRKTAVRRTVTPATPGAPVSARARGTRRDPFVSPIVERVLRTPAPCTGTGKQCLYVGDITLHGVVRYPGGYIAIVVNGDHTYFLRENDPLADGAVERITPDAMTVRERYLDPLGRTMTREVTKKVGVPAL